MFLDQLGFLLEFYWPYLLGALAIGLVAGWVSYSGAERVRREMALLMHGAEIAALLALAYSLGWGIGFAARRAATPVAQKSPVPAARMAAVTGAAMEAPVRAPVVAPLAIPPVPDFVRRPVATAFPATRPGLAWAGHRSGHVAAPFVRARQTEPDEDAAMRAVEGGWSPGAARGLADVGAAVAAAELAVTEVLARAGVRAEDAASLSRPAGIARPRDGKRDDLKVIAGLAPLDETTLNNLGIFHFDQIAAWNGKEVLWLENHAFAPGRIGRENWQGQARALLADDAA